MDPHSYCREKACLFRQYHLLIMYFCINPSNHTHCSRGKGQALSLHSQATFLQLNGSVPIPSASLVCNEFRPDSSRSSCSPCGQAYINPLQQKRPYPNGYGLSKCWHYLSSRAVTRQVLSTQMSLTSVFGMGTGGPSSQSIPTIRQS